MLHEVEEEEDPEHSVPPLIGPTFDLVRVMVPEPQDLEQEPHDPHGLHVHATEINSDRNVNVLMNTKMLYQGNPVSW